MGNFPQGKDQKIQKIVTKYFHKLLFFHDVFCVRVYATMEQNLLQVAQNVFAELTTKMVKTSASEFAMTLKGFRFASVYNLSPY